MRPLFLSLSLLLCIACSPKKPSNNEYQLTREHTEPSTPDKYWADIKIAKSIDSVKIKTIAEEIHRLHKDKPQQYISFYYLQGNDTMDIGGVNYTPDYELIMLPSPQDRHYFEKQSKK
jgi:hypothetical protein